MAAKKLIHGLQDRSDETAKKETIKLARTFGNIELEMNLCIGHKLTIIFFSLSTRTCFELYIFRRCGSYETRYDLGKFEKCQPFIIY